MEQALIIENKYKMNKLLFGVLLLLIHNTNSYATGIDTTAMQEAEATMYQLIEEIRTNKIQQVRIESSRQLEELMKTTLAKEGAYEYAFDDLEGISILQPQDKKFRIFTWQIYIDKSDYQYRGYLQKADGTVFPLEDKSEQMRGVEFSLLKPENWYGALYYNMKTFKHDGQDCYLLFGLDMYGFFNRRKVLDVLYFDGNGKPRFGKTVLEMKDGRGRLRKVKRMLLEYSATVSVTLNYNEDLDRVVFDHLIYGSPIRGEMPTNVPDGSYSGMVLTKDGIWKYVDKIYKDDPNNVLINATSFETILQEDAETNKGKKKKKKDIFGRSK